MSQYQNQTIALAGIQQSLYLIQEIAWQGRADENQIKTCLLSLFNFEPSNFEQVYGNQQQLRTGYQALVDSLQAKRNPAVLERTRYFANLLVLSRHVSPQSELSRQFYTTLSMLESDAQEYDERVDNLVSRLAQLYKNTLSNMTPKIIISGEPTYLKSENNAAKIRALLLTAVRGCILWRQAGGSQWKLLWGRKKILDYAQQALS